MASCVPFAFVAIVHDIFLILKVSFHFSTIYFVAIVLLLISPNGNLVMVESLFDRVR